MKGDKRHPSAKAWDPEWHRRAPTGAAVELQDKAQQIQVLTSTPSSLLTTVLALSATTTPSLQMRKLRPREEKQLVQGTVSTVGKHEPWPLAPTPCS